MPAYLIWLIVGLALCASEIFVGAFVQLVFGVAALLTGALIGIFAIESLVWQLTIYAFFSLVVGAITYAIMRNHKAPSIGQSKQFVGEVGIVINSQGADSSNVLATTTTGQVRFQKPILGSDLWAFRTKEAILLKIGDRVRLVEFQGKDAVVEAAE